jgi:hypothetical protein
MGIASRTNSSDDDDLANVNDIRATRDGDQKEDGDESESKARAKTPTESDSKTKPVTSNMIP